MLGRAILPCILTGFGDSFGAYRSVDFKYVIPVRRVGTGVNDAERDTLAKRLEPWFVDNIKGKNCVPRCYRTTGMPKERPDVWIKDPTRSVVLQVMTHAHVKHCYNYTTQLSNPLLLSLNRHDMLIVCLHQVGPFGVMQVQADVRTIVSKTFASRHSLRFPRVQRVRWDKSPMDIQTDQELWDIVESNQGAIVGEQLPPHCLHCR